MLVLTRKLGETIVIDGGMTVRVLRVKGNRVRLGIEAPREVPVRRGELEFCLAGTAAAGPPPAGDREMPSAACCS